MLADDDPAPRLPTTAGERWALVIIAAVLASLLVAEIATGFARVKLSFLFALASWAPLLVLHELGHAAAARLAGWRVSEIVIGFGRELARFRVGRTRVRLLSAPIEGYVVPSPTDTRNARLKCAWIYAAGPGAELGYVAACWLWFGQELLAPSDRIGLLAVQGSCLSAVMGAGFNLIPYSSGDSVSDGLGIITSLTRGDNDFAGQLSAPFVREARGELLREEPAKAASWVEHGLAVVQEDWQLRATSAVCAAAKGRSAEAIEQLEQLGDLEEKPPGVRVELLLDAAWTVLFAKDRTLLPDAQRACERALRLCPGHVRGSLIMGQVLLERQRPEAAAAHLMTGYKLTRDESYEAQFEVYLAKAFHQAGKVDYAARFVTEAKRRSLPPALLRALEEHEPSTR